MPIACSQDDFGVATPLLKPFLVGPDGVFERDVPIGMQAAGVTMVLQAYDAGGMCLSNLVIVTFD